MSRVKIYVKSQSPSEILRTKNCRLVFIQLTLIAEKLKNKLAFCLIVTSSFIFIARIHWMNFEAIIKIVFLFVQNLHLSSCLDLFLRSKLYNNFKQLILSCDRLLLKFK